MKKVLEPGSGGQKYSLLCSESNVWFHSMPPGRIFHAFLSFADFFSKMIFFEEFFQEYHQSVKQLGPRSGPT